MTAADVCIKRSLGLVLPRAPVLCASPMSRPYDGTDAGATHRPSLRPNIVCVFQVSKVRVASEQGVLFVGVSLFSFQLRETMSLHKWLAGT